MEVLNLSFEEAIDEFQRFSFSVNFPRSKWVDEKLFEPGEVVEVKMGYANNTKLMMVGEIVSLSCNFPESGTPQLEIGGYDLSYQLTRINMHNTWHDTRASTVVKKLLCDPLLRNKFEVNSNITETDIVRTIVQNGQTHYQFIKELAKQNAFSVYVKEDKLFFGPAEKAKEIFELEYGKSLLSFTPEINTANQVGSVTVIGYEPKKKKAVVGKAERKPDKPGKNGVSMEKIVGNVEVKVTNRSATNKQQASMLAKSILEESSAGLLKGSAKSIGIPDIRVGTK